MVQSMQKYTPLRLSRAHLYIELSLKTKQLGTDK